MTVASQVMHISIGSVLEKLSCGEAGQGPESHKRAAFLYFGMGVVC